MRLLAGLVLLVFVTIVLATNVFRPAPAADRLAGVSVAVAGYTIKPEASDRHELHLTVKVTSAKDIDECVGFTLPGEFVIGTDGIIALAHRYGWCEDYPDPRVHIATLRLAAGNL